MKKKLGLLSLVVLSIFLMAGSVGAVSFAVNDLLLNSPHRGATPDVGFSGAGYETPQRHGNLLKYTQQNRGLEGMFGKPDGSTPAVGGGFYGLNGVNGESIHLNFGNDTLHGAAPVPEPATVLLLGAGLVGLGLFSRRRMRQTR